MRNTGDQRLVSGANCGRDILLSFAECSATLSWYLFFCAGKLSDVMCVPPWLMYGFSYATAIKISHVAGNLAFDNY